MKLHGHRTAGHNPTPGDFAWSLLATVVGIAAIYLILHGGTP